MFSVVIPVYNNRATLARTVASVFAQSFSDFELIVVDDGSTDGSLSLLHSMADPRLRILSQENAGPGPARNAGVEASRADWIAFLDADDIWLDDHLEELDRIRRAHPEAGLIGTAFMVARAGSIPAALPPRSGSIRLIDYFDAVGSGEHVLRTSTAAVRKDRWRALGGFRDRRPSAEDSEFWVRLALRWPVAVSTKATAIYLTGTGGITDTMRRTGLRKPPKELADLSPAVAALIPELANRPPDQRASMERFIARYRHWRLHEAARSGDIPTLRALRKLHPRQAPSSDKAILAAASLPAPVARAAHASIYLALAVARRIGGRLRRSP